MNKRFIIPLLLVFLAMPIVLAQDQVDLYLFYGKTCPHCAVEIRFLNSIEDKYPELVINEFEISSKENAILFSVMCEAYGTKPMGVPMTFIGEDYWSGFGGPLVVELENKIRNCIENGCADPGSKVGLAKEKVEIAVKSEEQAVEISKKNKLVQELLEEDDDSKPIVDYINSNYIVKWETGTKNIEVYVNRASGEITQVLQQGLNKVVTNENQTEQKITAKNPEIDVPLIGKIDVSKIGLPLFTLVIAFVDGFNPCTMWVLSFLLVLLIHLQNRKKIFIVGSVFLLVVYIIYFLFMAAWLNLFLYLGYVDIIRIIIASIAIAAGLINMKDFFWFKRGISLSIPDRFKPRLFEKMRNIVKEESLVLTVIGTIILASFASLIELPCTSGFPAIYVRILTLQGLEGISYYSHILLYCLIYIMPLTVVIALFAFFMKGEKMSEKVGKILKLIGGLIMLILGLLLLISPNLLMFA
ncbi:MAG: hypothetical protein U9O94_08105 [Nanoarchaeota archaeon]|nr:hypothetical protein [Nanoarchaeota archaeon]